MVRNWIKNFHGILGRESGSIWSWLSSSSFQFWTFSGSTTPICQYWQSSTETSWRNSNSEIFCGSISTSAPVSTGTWSSLSWLGSEVLTISLFTCYLHSTFSKAPNLSWSNQLALYPNFFRALYQKSVELASTFFFMIILIYTYSFILADEFSDEFEDHSVRPCDSLILCFVYTINLGLRNGGGIGDSLKFPDHNNSNFALITLIEISFFILINIVMLNIIFGLIIDAFSELRDSETEKRKLPVCLVSNSVRELHLEYLPHMPKW